MIEGAQHAGPIAQTGKGDAGRFIHGRRQLPGYVTFQKGTEYAFLGHDAATQDDDLGLQYGDDVAYGDGYVTGQVVNGPEGIRIAFGGHRKDGFAIEFVRADSFGRGDVADQTGNRCQAQWMIWPS